MELRLLMSEGCPAWQETKDNLYAVVAERGLDAKIEVVDIDKQPEIPECFYGSPTVNYRENESEAWKDLFGQTGKSSSPSCRLYGPLDKSTMVVPKDMIKARLEELYPAKD